MPIWPLLHIHSKLLLSQYYIYYSPSDLAFLFIWRYSDFHLLLYCSQSQSRCLGASLCCCFDQEAKAIEGVVTWGPWDVNHPSLYNQTGQRVGLRQSVREYRNKSPHCSQVSRFLIWLNLGVMRQALQSGDQMHSLGVFYKHGCPLSSTAKHLVWPYFQSISSLKTAVRNQNTSGPLFDRYRLTCFFL